MNESIGKTNYLLRGHVENIQARSFINKDGQEVPQGRLQSRVVFQGFEDDRLAPAAKEVFSESSYLKTSHEWGAGLLGYVKLHLVNDQSSSSDLIEIMVNVDDLAQRLDLSRTEILDASKEGKLEDFLKERLTGRMHEQQGMSSILKTLKEQTNELSEKYTNAMLSQGRTPDLTNSDLSHIIKEGYTQILKDSLGFQSTVAFQTGSAVVELGERTFLVGMGHDRRLTILEMDSAEADPISRGSFGVIQPQSNLLYSGRGILKLPVDSGLDNEMSQQEYLKASTKLLESEARILDKLWDGAESPIEGIQHPPYMTVSINRPEEGILDTFIYTKRYEGESLDKWNESPQANTLPKSSLMNLARQGLSGLEHMQTRNVVNGDIKAMNICIDLDPDGSPSLKIIDWGGAVDLNETAPPFPWLTSPILTASSYETPKESFALSELSQEYWMTSWFGKKRANKVRDRFNQVQHARDTLSLSIELVHLMTGTSPMSQSYSFESRSVNVEETRRTATRQLAQCGYPESVQLLFDQLLEPQPEERLSPSEALKRLDEIVAKGGDWLQNTRTERS